MIPVPRRRSLVFFVVLALLTALAVVTLIAYNLGQQLRPDQVAAARARWEAEPREDYDLVIAVKQNDGPSRQVAVRVRGGQPVHVTRDPETADVLPTRPDMTALFDLVEEQLRRDVEAGRRPFVRATFDPTDGHLVRYVRRVSRSRERLELAVMLRPPAPPAGANVRGGT